MYAVHAGMVSWEGRERGRRTLVFFRCFHLCFGDVEIRAVVDMELDFAEDVLDNGIGLCCQRGR